MTATPAPAPSAPTVVIVGGVAGGASAATRARRADENARVVLLEKEADVSYANCGLPYRLSGEVEDRASLLVARRELLERRFAIEVHTRSEVRSIDRAAKTIDVLDRDSGETWTQRYDKLVLSPGASPVVPDVPGAHARGVFTLRALDDADRILDAIASARRAVVVGGGFVGLEVAEQLRRRGLEVAVVEREAHVLPPLDPEMAEPVHREMERAGVGLHLGAALASIEEGHGAVRAVRLADGSRIDADVVVLALGVRPNTALATAAGIAIGASGAVATDEHQRTTDPDVYAVGDAAETAYGPSGGHARVPLAGPANRAGRLAGEHAVRGDAAAAPEAWGTAIVRVFGRTAAVTGFSLAAARRAGLDARAVHVVANHHAGWFPGAETMVLKLVYEAGTGRVLGAQATGGAGVDKRIDVVATVLHHRGTVHDLGQLDLAYAPQFGSAKDPLHLVGFAAENDLSGFSRLAPVDADLADHQVVDVRTAQEIAELPLDGVPHALRIPVDDLRDRLSELDPARPTVVVCRTGVRAHVAVRILVQRGFRDVRNLSGGAVVRDLLLRRSPAPASTAVSAPCAAPTCGSEPAGPGVAPLELAQRLASGQADVVDVRTGAEFRASHVRGSRHVPLDDFDVARVLAGRRADADGPTLLVCRSGSRARMAAQRLRAAGVACAVVEGGVDACAAAGLDLEGEGRSSVWPIERQVRLVAGLLILLGAGIGLLHPIGWGLAAFVGAGLTFAGATDFCGMALLLGRCRWNR
jgi:NADPH-dependent 2,4-dienoyl-CoA reductase/sulfur reductase-like enzyme/rhodanese-related sulfurtransferase